MKNIIQYWWLSYAIIMASYIVVFLTKSALGSGLAVPIVVLAALFVMSKAFHGRYFHLPKNVRQMFMVTVMLLVIFVIKFMLQGDYNHWDLTLKIALYHLTFIAGILAVVVVRDHERDNGAGLLLSLVVFVIPVLFFTLFARNYPQSDSLFFFNRNSFASTTLILSTLLLGLTSFRPLLTFKHYLILLSVLLVLNGTAGAIVAFIIAMLIYLVKTENINKSTLIFAGLGTIFSFVLIALLSVGLDLFSKVPVIEKLKFVTLNFTNLYQSYTGSWLQLDMETAVKFAPDGELHMSAMFRFLHLVNIISVLLQDGVTALLYGGGVGWIDLSRTKFAFSLAAHDEYLRIIMEQGVLLGGVYIICLLRFGFNLIKYPVGIPLLAWIIFLAFENQLNNFATTSLAFFLLGYAVAMQKLRGNPVPEFRAKSILRNKERLSSREFIE